MKAITETAVTAPACPTCSAESAGIVRVPPAAYHVCLVCDTHFQSPMPTIEQMRDYVQREYAAGVYNDYAAASALKAATFARRAAAIRKRAPGGRTLLDVGAACGFFVEQALLAGFDAYGIELSSEAVSKAAPQLRDRLTVGDLNTLAVENKSFDVITAFDVVEHVFDPVAFLRSLHAVSHPGTLIAISTPDTGHFLRNVLRQRWPMYQPMQHTVLFSRRGLRLALSKAGYRDIAIGPATKTLTADYLAGQVEMYLPALVRGYRALETVVPEGVRKAPVNVNIGELFAFARSV